MNKLKTVVNDIEEFVMTNKENSIEMLIDIQEKI